MSVAPDHPSLGRWTRRPALLALRTLDSGDVEVRAAGRPVGRIAATVDGFAVTADGAPVAVATRVATLTEALDLLSAAPPASTGLPRR